MIEILNGADKFDALQNTSASIVNLSLKNGFNATEMKKFAGKQPLLLLASLNAAKSRSS